MGCQTKYWRDCQKSSTPWAAAEGERVGEQAVEQGERAEHDEVEDGEQDAGEHAPEALSEL